VGHGILLFAPWKELCLCLSNDTFSCFFHRDSTVTVLDVGGTNELCTTDALFLVNCWFSNFMNFSSINVSDTKMWISTSSLWGATWDSWKSHLLLEISLLYKFLSRLIGVSPWIMAPWKPHFWNHQLPCFWHETIPVRSADHEVVSRYHGSRCHFVRLVLWARPMIFGGKGKAKISGRAGYHSHVSIYVYIY
jgi:hypothetical protein